MIKMTSKKIERSINMVFLSIFILAIFLIVAALSANYF